MYNFTLVLNRERFSYYLNGISIKAVRSNTTEMKHFIKKMERLYGKLSEVNESVNYCFSFQVISVKYVKFLSDNYQI